MLRQLLILPLLVRMDVKAQMEYRGAFWLDRFAQILTYGSSFAVIWLLVSRFGVLAGWNWPDLALLFAFQLLGYSIGASVSFTQFRDLEEKVRLGTLDVLLVKPFSLWAYLVFSGLNIGYVGHIALALGVMAWTLFFVDINWSIGAVLYLLAALVSATLVTASLLTMIGASAMIWTRSNHLFSIFFGVWELTRYPLDIFPAGIQTVLLTIVPLGFTSAVPVAVLLGKHVPLLGDWAMPLSLLAGPLLTLVAIVHWRNAVNKYQGAGG